MKSGLRLSPEALRQLRAERDAVRAPEGIEGAIGFEAEFNVLLDGQQVKPEDVFKSPRNIVRDPMVSSSACVRDPPSTTSSAAPSGRGGV